MPIVINDTLPLGGDQDSTLEYGDPEDWLTTPHMLALLEKEGPGAVVGVAAAASSLTRASAQQPPVAVDEDTPSRSIVRVLLLVGLFLVC